MKSHVLKAKINLLPASVGVAGPRTGISM